VASNSSGEKKIHKLPKNLLIYIKVSRLVEPNLSFCSTMFSSIQDALCLKKKVFILFLSKHQCTFIDISFMNPKPYHTYRFVCLSRSLHTKELSLEVHIDKILVRKSSTNRHNLNERQRKRRREDREV
jgi:hypothetical protein